MISTVTVSTVSTVTTITTSTVTGLVGALGLIVIIALIFLLSAQEIARATSGSRRRTLARFLSVATVPLILVVLFIIGIRVAGALT